MNTSKQHPAKKGNQDAPDSAALLQILAQHEQSTDALLPVLHAVQHHFGYIADTHVPHIALALNLSRAEVHGVVTGYAHFRQKPHGKHILRLCQAEACQAVGGRELFAHAQKVLDTDGQKNTASAVSLEPVYCLGLCACGPSAQLDDDRVLGRLTKASLDTLITELLSEPKTP